ncbi:MAG: Ig-like domain-containing protein [Thermoplasmata archaeon]|nr:MAG: Ig-like domain-containing protein [Thermoplasmata archaeon]
MRKARTPKTKGQIEAVLLIYAIVATSILVILPLNTPNASAYDHLTSTIAEDGDITYDEDNTMNTIVVWIDPQGSGEDHFINDHYTVEANYTLEIPALDYQSNEVLESVIYLSDFRKIDVLGTLITNTDGPMNPTKTPFMKGGLANWDGIYFYSGSDGQIQDCLFRETANGLVFYPDSSLNSPGIYNVKFDEMINYGIRMDGVVGVTDIAYGTFDDSAYEATTALIVKNGSLNMSDCMFLAHGINKPQIHMLNTDAYIDTVYFDGNFVTGNEVLIEGNSGGTVLETCYFMDGAASSYYVLINGTDSVLVNCSFETSSGEYSVRAIENATGAAAHPIVRNPAGDGPQGSFDNTTMNAIGASSVTLQWYLDVYVQDPDGNPIPNAPVFVNDTFGNPALPATMLTDPTGWARGFITTELTQYEFTTDYYNPFNVFAFNNSIWGYAAPEVTMNMSKNVTVTVPFTMAPNTPPEVSWLPTPVGLQSGNITIQYMLSDPDPGDDGNLKVSVYRSPDNFTFATATPGPGGDPTTGLYNDTLYYFVWDSVADIGLTNTTVYIKIVPEDMAGTGIESATGGFFVDNKPPTLVSGPTVTPTKTSAIIEWTVDELANATVWYGLTPGLTNEKSNNSGTTVQSVELTGLVPGTNYTFIINSTDPWGNKYSSFPVNFTFETVTDDTVDFILITVDPGGAEVTDKIVNIGYIEWGNASSFNTSTGFLNTVTASWTIEGGTTPSLGPTPAISTWAHVGYGGGVVWFNASYFDGSQWHYDSVMYTVMPPTLDFIRLTDLPGGTEITDTTWNIVDPLLVYASGYNYTGNTYIDLVDVQWTDTPVGGGAGNFDNNTGTSTTFTGTSTGIVEIRGENASKGVSDTFQKNLYDTSPVIDTIIITDGPDGNPLGTVDIPIGGSVEAFASGYNGTGLTFVDLVEVSWSEDPSNLGDFNTTKGKSVKFTALTTAGSVNITGQNSSMVPIVSNNFTVNIMPPTVDSIKITDAPNGNELTTVTLGPTGTVDAYVSSYNSTGPTYVGLDNVVWNGPGGTWSPASGPNSTFTAGTTGGLYVQSFESTNYVGFTDSFNIKVDTAGPSINHTPVTSGISGTPINITAVVADADSGVDNVTLYYKKQSDTTYTEVQMNANGNTYYAVIPGTAATTAGLEYYIKAGDIAAPSNIAYYGSTGETSTEPLATNDIDITITADTTPPSVSHTPVTSGTAGTVITITAVVTDADSGVENVYLYYKKPSETTYTQVPMSADGNTYSADIPGAAVTSEGLEYYIKAVDVKGNPRYYGAVGPTETEPTAANDVNIAVPSEDTVSPTVIGTNPADGSTNIPIDSTIRVTFSEAMNQIPTQSAFSISPSVSWSPSWSGNTLIFTPTADLGYGTIYNITIGSEATDLAGNNLATYSWEFTTVSSSVTGPEVDEYEPRGANIRIEDTKIMIKFTQNMNHATTEGAISIEPASPEFVPTWLGGDTIILTPTGSLRSNTRYYVNVSTNATSANGEHLVEKHSWYFHTEKVKGESAFWETWEPIITGVTILASLIAFLIGFLSLRRKRSKLRHYLDDIDDTYDEYKENPQRCEEELIALRESIKKEVRRGRLEENHFLILDKKIDEYLLEMKSKKDITAIGMVTGDPSGAAAEEGELGGLEEEGVEEPEAGAGYEEGLEDNEEDLRPEPFEEEVKEPEAKVIVEERPREIIEEEEAEPEERAKEE